MTVICATGHRKGDPEELLNLARSSLSKLREEIKLTEVWCGGAIGWDMAVEIACLELEIPLRLCLPCYHYESKWPKELQALHREIVKLAETVEYVYKGEYPGNWCLNARNKAMIDRCQLVIAYWDKTQLTGGTFHAVKYAASKGKRVINVKEEA